MNLTVEEILNCTKGRLIIGEKTKECKNFSKDTRTIEQGDTYIGIKGEKFDGNLFWKEAFHKGADIVIIEECELNPKDLDTYKQQNKCMIQVRDTILAIGQMASYKKKCYQGKLKVIGITGSVGKTSTKDMIASVASQKYKTLKTEGNNNNNIGLPLTILRLQEEEVAVIEMGMNHLGEISYLSKIAKPDLAIITNIGTSHIGNLGSRQNILKAKLEILEGMEQKKLIINSDNDLLNQWNLEEKGEIEVHTFGIHQESEFQAEDIELQENSSQFICNTQEEKISLNVPVAGEHFILNALCATAVGKLLGLNQEQIKNGIENFQLTAKRMEIKHLKNNILLINDSYNASYESMKAAIVSLKNRKAKRKIAVLGDMFELGEFSEKLHREVGKEIYLNSIDLLYLIGENARYIGEEAEDCGYDTNNIHYFKNKEDLLKELNKTIQEDDVILLKASNGMKLFEIADSISE